MKFLLDTYTVLWLFEGNENLPPNIRELIYCAENEVYASIVSAWEIAIKVGLNKLDFKGGVAAFFAKLSPNNIDLIYLSQEHIEFVETLPMLHRDSFDRLLVPTALAENLTIITIDENIHKYDAAWIWQPKGDNENEKFKNFKRRFAGCGGVGFGVYGLVCPK